MMCLLKHTRNKPTAELLTEYVSSTATADVDAAEHGWRTKSCLSKSFNASIRKHTQVHQYLTDSVTNNQVNNNFARLMNSATVATITAQTAI